MWYIYFNKENHWIFSVIFPCNILFVWFLLILIVKTTRSFTYSGCGARIFVVFSLHQESCFSVHTHSLVCSVCSFYILNFGPHSAMLRGNECLALHSELTPSGLGYHMDPSGPCARQMPYPRAVAISAPRFPFF